MKTVKQTILDNFFNPGWGRVEIHSGDFEELVDLMTDYTNKIVDEIIKKVGDSKNKEKIEKIRKLI